MSWLTSIRLVSQGGVEFKPIDVIEDADNQILRLNFLQVISDQFYNFNWYGGNPFHLLDKISIDFGINKIINALHLMLRVEEIYITSSTPNPLGRHGLDH